MAEIKKSNRGMYTRRTIAKAEAQDKKECPHLFENVKTYRDGPFWYDKCRCGAVVRDEYPAERSINQWWG